MENPMVNYAKIIAETNSKMYNVRDEYKNNSVEENIAICNKEHLKFSVGCINITGELNIGMMIRSACLLGAENFYIFGRNKFDRRSTVGAENYINIVQYSYDDPIHADAEINERLEYMLKWNTVVLCEQGGDEIGSRKMALKYSEEIINPLFVFGSESHGIPPLITTNEHFYKVSIPQRGVLRSFNVSAAMNIIVWDYIKEMHL
jgi:tRNA G18 (ribose-2'-O)-methylase SpoU